MNCAGIVRFEAKNKSNYGENLNCTFDRAIFLEYKSNIFPTISFFVPKKIELLSNQCFPRLIGRIKFLKQDIYSKTSVTEHPS